MTAGLLSLRDYQREAIDSVTAAWRRGMIRPAVVLPTASGKTVIFSHLSVEWLADNPGKRVLILVHTQELLDQALSKLRSVAPGLRVGAVQADRNETLARVVVATVQTLRNERRRRMLRDVGLIICDEAHHAVAVTYRTIFNHFGVLGLAPGEAARAVAVGFTATMVRADDLALGDVWQDVVCMRTISDMVEAGYLVRPKGIHVQVDDLDLTKVKTSAGDYQAGALGEAVETSMAPEAIAKAVTEHADQRKILLFAPTVSSAGVIADALSASGRSVGLIHGGLAAGARKAVLDDFRRDRTQVLSGVAVLTEGFDEPSADCVVLARPTKSLGLYCLDASTEILTDLGWRGIGESLDGARAAGFDLSDGSIQWSSILGRIERELFPGERMFEIEAPSLSVRVSDRHTMVWRGRRDEAWRLASARELASRRSGYVVPIAGEQKSSGIPLTDDEIRFIGWFMTDGTLNRATGQIIIYQAEHQPMNVDIRACLQGCGFKYSVHRNEQVTRFRRTSAGLRYCISRGAPRGRDSHLRGWGVLADYLDKDLSVGLESMDARQLGILLHAMHLGDGSKQAHAARDGWTRRSYHIASGRRALVDRLQSLCVRRGFKCNISPITSNLSPAWNMHIKATRIRAVGGSGDGDRSRLVESSRRPGELVWCIETEQGTLVTRRDGKVAILGNCQIAGRVLRPYPGKTDALILDVVGATKLHGLVAGIDLFGEAPKEPKDPSDEYQENPDELDEGQQDARQALGVDGPLVSTEVDLFAASSSRWLRTRAGVFFIPAGDRYIAILPSPPQTPEQWRDHFAGRGGLWGYDVVTMHKNQLHTERAIVRGVPDLSYAMAWAEGDVTPAEKTTASKERRWQARPLSDKTRALAQKLSIYVPPGARMGEVSNMITLALATRRIDAHLPAYLKGKS